MFCLASVVGRAQRLQLAHVDVQAPEPPVLLSLRLDVEPPPQVLQTDGRLCHGRPCLPCCRRHCRTAGPLRSTGITPLRRYCGPLRHPLAVRPLPRVRRLYGLPSSADFAAGRGGLLQLLDVSLSPCRRYHPAGVTRRVSQPATGHAAFALSCGLGLRGFALSGPPLRSLPLRPGDSLTIPTMALSMGFRSSVSLLPAIQATGLLALTPAGLTPAEHVSLLWTHAEPCASPCTAKAPPATSGPTARARRGDRERTPPRYARTGPRRARCAAQMRRHLMVETDTVCVLPSPFVLA